MMETKATHTPTPEENERFDRAMLDVEELLGKSWGDIVHCVDTHDELLEALKVSALMLRKYHEDCGECDHSVNICVCDIVRAREQAEQAIAKAEGRGA